MLFRSFIEPKGNEFIGDDGTFKTGKEGWKEMFLEQIAKKYGSDNIIKAENKKYSLVGLPFSNKDHNQKFGEAFNRMVLNNRGKGYSDL